MALSVSQAVKPAIEAAGFSVFLTRNADADMMGEAPTGAGMTPEKARRIMKYRDLKARCNYANYLKAAAFISLHLDAPPEHIVVRSNPSGNTIYYAQGSDQAYRLATVVYASIVPLPMVDRGVRSDAERHLRVLRDTAMPSILMECGFLSNANDRAWLSDPANQDQLGRALASGLTAYFA
jgi:N-acetylmuramoyl-L-alanine amidase